MGVCWCKDKAPDEEEDTYVPSSGSVAVSPAAVDLRVRTHKAVDSVIVDRLVLEMLSLIASFVNK